MGKNSQVAELVDAKTCAVLYNELKTYSKHNGERDL